MKKIVQFSVVLLLFSNTLLAQNISVGIKHGVNFSGINFKYDDSNELLNSSYFGFDNIRSNLNLGVYFNYTLQKHFSFQTELNFINRGFEFYPSQLICGGGIDRGNYKTTYFSVPLLACYGLVKL